jgi:hypothetical protein
LLDNQLTVEKPKKEWDVVTLVFQTWRLLAYPQVVHQLLW